MTMPDPYGGKNNNNAMEIDSGLPTWPQVGIGETTGPRQLEAVRQMWDLAPLQQLRRDLNAEYPRRTQLIHAVERQIVRCELYGLMGQSITTLANIYADDKLLKTTTARDVKLNTVQDQPLEDGQQYSVRLIALWNASLRDSEVATIRDIVVWAQQVNAEYIVSRKKIVIEVIGT